MSPRRRIALAPLTLLVIALVTFALLELVPGDPALMRLGLGASEASRRALRDALGLSGGVWQRAAGYFGHLLRGDLGRSLVDGRLVRDKIVERLPVTAALAVAALALAWAVALPLALYRAACGRSLGVEVGLGALYAIPVPAIALAILAAGAPYGGSLGAVLAAAACLAPLLVPQIYAQAARALDEAAAADDQRTLRAIGAPTRRLVRSALRGQALRLVTLAALQLPALLSGAVLVEAVFGLPGLGLLAFDAMAARDQPVLLGLVLVGAALCIGATVAVDLAAPLFDPRLSSPRSARS